MTCKTSKHYPWLLAASLLLLTSCGGGGGGSGSSGASGTGGNPGNGGPAQPSPAGLLNPGLPGRFFFRDANTTSVWFMEAATGKFTRIPNTSRNDWLANDAVFVNATTFDLSADRSGIPEFLIRTGSGCRRNGGLAPTQCVVFHDYDGNILDSFLIEDSLSVGAEEMSWDHQHVAAFSDDITIGNDQDFLEIYRRSDGALISRTELDRRGITWLPNNRLIYQDIENGNSKQYIALSNMK